MVYFHLGSIQSLLNVFSPCDRDREQSCWSKISMWYLGCSKHLLKWVVMIPSDNRCPVLYRSMVSPPNHDSPHLWRYFSQRWWNICVLYWRDATLLGRHTEFAILVDCKLTTEESSVNWCYKQKKKKNMC